MGMFDHLIPRAPKEPGLIRSAADTGVALAKGGALGVKMLSDAFGADNAVSRVAGDAVDAIGSLESAYSKWEQQLSAREMQDAAGTGFMNEAGAAVKAFARRPIDFTAEAIGTSLPTIAAAFLPGGQTAAIMRIGGMLGLGAAQGAGAVKGQIFEAVQDEWTKAGATPEEAAARAARAQEYFGDNAGQVALGTALGAAAGRLGVEANILSKRILANAAPEAGTSLLKRAGQITGKGAMEAGPEALQGGQEQYASNSALRNEGFDVDPMEGVVGNATLEALGGFGAGGLAEVAMPERQGDVRDIGDAEDADQAIDAFRRATTLALPPPALQSDWEVVDGQQALTGPPGAPPGAPSMLLPAPDGSPVYMADERGNVAVQPAAARTEAQNRDFERQQLEAELAAAVAAMGKQTPRGEAPADKIPTGEATRAEVIPTGDATELEPIPTGEATEILPAGDATELGDEIPTGEATELDPEQVIAPGAPGATDGDGREDPPDAAGGVGAARVPDRPQPGGPGAVRDERLGAAPDAADSPGGSDRPGEGAAGPADALSEGYTDLMTGDGKPYGTRSGAAVRAKKDGGEVVEVEGGWVVRQGKGPTYTTTKEPYNGGGIVNALVDAQIGGAKKDWGEDGGLEALKASGHIDAKGNLTPKGQGLLTRLNSREARENKSPEELAGEIEAAIGLRTIKREQGQAEPSPGESPGSPPVVPGDTKRDQALEDVDAGIAELGGVFGKKAAPKKTPAELGREAFEAGQQRRPPVDLVISRQADEWLRAWDLANIAEPVPGVPTPNDRNNAPAPAAPQKQRKTHPSTVMGSTLLAAVSAKLGGLDLSLLSEYSTKVETGKADKNGKPLFMWRNPMIPGIGKLFRTGGRLDRGEIAQVVEDEGYLEPGSVEADYKEAGERAKDVIKGFLQRDDIQTLDEQQAELEAGEEAERQAYYAELDAESAADMEAERQAIMAEAGMEPEEQDGLDDVPWDAPGSTDRASAMRAMGFSEQEIADETGQEPGPRVGPEEAAGAAPEGAREGREAGEDPADAPRGQEGEAQGLKRDPGQLPEGVRARVQAAVDSLATIRDDLQRQLDARGHGYTFKLGLIEQLPAIRSAREPLNEFRKHAERQGFNAEAIIAKLGGDLNLEPFVVNDKAPSLTLPNDERLLVMPCCEGKLDSRAPAGELYQGVMWQTLRAHQPAGGMPNVLILSAKHGLIDQATPIDPYDQRMTPERLAELQRDMLDNVAELERVLEGRTINDVLIVGAGDYRAVMAEAVAELMAKGRLVKPGATVNAVEGQIGEQRAALGEYLRALPGGTGESKLASGVAPNENGVFSTEAEGVENITLNSGNLRATISLAQLASGKWITARSMRYSGYEGGSSPLKDIDALDSRADALERAVAGFRRSYAEPLAGDSATRTKDKAKLVKWLDSLSGGASTTGALGGATMVEGAGNQWFLNDPAAGALQGPIRGVKNRAEAEAWLAKRDAPADAQPDAEAEPEGLVVMPADPAAVADALAEFSGQAQEDPRVEALFNPTDKKPTSSNGTVGARDQATADKVNAELVADAKKQGRKGDNARWTVISLFDASGAWSQPWVDAGYNVVRYDLQDGQDINEFSAEMLLEEHGNDDVWAILAAPPCTDFASSGAQYWKEKDADGRTEASNELVRQVLRTVELLRPAVWAMENPVGRMAKLNGLPKPLLTFQPNAYGDPYTKKTQLWGNFNNNLVVNVVRPTEGSKIAKLSSGAQYERSLTPSGFAYSFWQSNGYPQTGQKYAGPWLSPAQALAQEFHGVTARAFEDALYGNPPYVGRKQMTHEQVRQLVQDAYYDGDLERVNELLQEAGTDDRPAAQEQRQADTAEDAAEAEGLKILDAMSDDQLKRAATELGISARSPRDRRTFIGNRLAGGRAVETLPALKKATGAKPARDDAIVELRKQQSVLQKLVECLSK